MFGAAFALLGVTVIFTAFTNIVLTGGLTVAIGQAVLGRKEMLGRAWRSTSRRIGALLAVVLLEALSLALGWMAAAALSIGAGCSWRRACTLWPWASWWACSACSPRRSSP